ncbi:MAG: HlyD family efflux transporter periplasmic adaptor subunit [Anaerolineae bacterium]|nr:HlyD family efflux transporter periplasmic adaptor subunit [Anaerolineae bacterium]
MKTWRILLIGVLLLTGCNAALSATTEPILPPVKADADVIAVEGVAEPARWVTLRTVDSRAVAEVFVAEGDAIRAGDALLRLDDTDAQLAIHQAEAALSAAQAQLALVRASARPEQLAALEAQVAVADAVISQTTALLTASQVNGIEADVADAQTAIAAAELACHQADQVHDDTMQCLDVSMPDGSTQQICPALGTYEEIARAQVTAAQAALDAARAQLVALRGPAGAKIGAAQASVQTALVQRDALQAQLDLAQAGATDATIAVAEAVVRESEAALAAARNLRADLTLAAPFDAIVSDIAIHPGDITTLGSALVTLATLNALHIRVKDLTELDIARVIEGQPVHITFNARPDTAFSGRVTRIDRQGQDYLGDVIYPVYIELDTMPDWAMWGMTTKCELQIANGEWQMANEESTIANQESPITDHASRIIAEAVIEPERWSEARFTIPGQIVEVLAQPGTSVRAGEVLARLDTSHATAAVRQAEAALATTRAQLALAQTGPRPESVTAAEAQVATAESDVARAIALRNQWTATERDAQVAAVRAQLETAQAEKRQLEAQWQWAKDGENDESALAYREQIAIVEQRIAAAETRLAVIPRVFAVQAQAADAGVRVTEAQFAAAQVELNVTQAGPRAEDIAVAQAAVRQAEATLAAAQATLAHTELRAPFAGTVTQVTVETGDLVTPEIPILVLATLDRLHVQTRDVLENDVEHISVGQPVTVKVDALPEVTFSGRVTQIKAQGVLYRDDVAFPVIIALDTPSPTLLWGMKATVEITP